MLLVLLWDNSLIIGSHRAWRGNLEVIQELNVEVRVSLLLQVSFKWYRHELELEFSIVFLGR